MRYCFCDVEGAIITQEDQCYDVARLEWNRAINQYPLIIVYCECVEDVQEAIRWSRKCHVPIRVRSGGHNYEGYSIGDCVLVIDVSQINTVEIDEERKLVKVGGGVKNRQFYDTISTKGYLLPFYRLCEVQMTYGSFFEAITKIQASYPSYEYFKSTGRFVDRPFDEEEIEKLLDIVNAARPIGSTMTSIGVYGLGGKTQEKSPIDTAFYYRNADYILNMQSVWTDNLYKEANVQWVKAYFPKLYKLTEGSYVNFPYSELKRYEKEYFGKNKHELQYIKSIYDPENVFCFPQSIQPRC